MAETVAFQVWVDAQLPPALVRWLNEHEAIAARHVADVELLTAADVTIFEAARANLVQVIVTKDEDFLNLLDRFGPPPQVVWVTCGNVRNAELREIVMSAWPRIVELLRAGEPLIELGRRA